MNVDTITDVESLNIEQIQNAIFNEGYQWLEHVFHKDDYPCQDGRDCFIRLTTVNDPQAFNFRWEHYDSSKEIGWGRFSRRYCWEEAYKAIVLKQ